jgi:glycosyltransferase involved in cell wall biosynthesis
LRILLANDGFGDAGGVQTYLDAVAAGLVARGHQLALLHRDQAPAGFAGGATRELPEFSLATTEPGELVDRIGRWRPDVCFSHNMNVIDLDRRLMARWPVVKFMHGYFGTCIGGQKRFGFPVAQPCGRRFGAACLALYGPRHCGELRFGTVVRQYQWAREQHAALDGYRAIVVASEHMKREFVRNGVASARVHVNPLFPTDGEQPNLPDRSVVSDCVAFVGRMTVLKGGDLLVDAVAGASVRLERTIRLLLIGDGPQRTLWERRASERSVPCTALGWLNGSPRWTALREAAVLALPSTWPEPFGLVGLEAAALGIPTIAFDVGGISEWLRHGVTGHLVPANPPRSAAFAEGLAHLLGHPAHLAALGRSAAAAAREMSLDAHLRRLESVFASHATDAHSPGR